MYRFHWPFACIVLFAFSFSQAQIITTVAGLINPNPVPGTSIGMNPLNVAADADGNIYFPDAENGVIRKLTPTGSLTTIAGNGTHGFSGDGGPALSAQFSRPFNIARDAAGNLYVSDDGNYKIRKITPAGIISTYAGNGTRGFSGDGGPATNAQLSATGLACDAAGNLYFCDTDNQRVRKVNASGIISTVAGAGTTGASVDGVPAVAFRLWSPFGIAVDRSSNFYITELGGAKILKVSASGIISTIAGNGRSGYSGDGGPAKSALIASSLGNVALDASGNVYIADEGNNRVRMISATDSIIRTVAGTGVNGYTGDGGAAISAQMSGPMSVSLDQAGNLYVPTVFCIRKIIVNGAITTVAGNRTDALSGDGGPALYAQFSFPTEVTVDAAGNVVIADMGNDRIRQIDKNGIITSIAGVFRGFNGDGGPAVSANVYLPSSITKTASGELYIADTYNNRIRKVDANGIITTIAGNGSNGYSGDGGPALSAALDFPSAVRTDAAGNIYFVQSNDHCIRRIGRDGIITTIAGNGTAGFAGDGGPATAALLTQPTGLAIDPANNILISDGGNNRIRKISPDGTITTIAGNGQSGFGGDGGNALAAGFNTPVALAIDPAGNLFVCDAGNSRVRKINTAGIITTVAGGGNDVKEGIAAFAAEIPYPASVAIDAAGNLYVSDRTNNRIRKVSLSALPLRLTDFTTALTALHVNCAWKTTDATNIQRFLVQRSVDGTSFTTIGSLPADTEHHSTSSYQYIDYNAAALAVRKLYYRLEVLDADGRKSYSQINQVDLPQQTGSFTLAPNPAHDMVTVTGISIKQFIITDQSGKVIRMVPATGNRTVLNVSGLGKGIYMIQAQYGDGTTSSKKLMVN